MKLTFKQIGIGASLAVYALLLAYALFHLDNLTLDICLILSLLSFYVAKLMTQKQKELN